MSQKIFFHPDGTASANPTTKEQAKKLRKQRYHDKTQPCAECGNSIRYTASDACLFCSRQEAIEFYNQSVMDGDPTDPLQANEKGLPYYVRTEPCNSHGCPGMRTAIGQCYFCEQRKAKPSPRQIALKNGATWYTPDTECPRCHTKAQRRVNNGDCQGCSPQSNSVHDIAAKLGDIVIDREAARVMGLKIFRTGKPCKYDHTGWRYISTGACLSCKKGA